MSLCSRLLYVVHAEKGDQAVVRIISARIATKTEVRLLRTYSEVHRER